MEQSNHNEIIVAGAMNAASNTGQQENSPHSPPYLKLIADCWEHIFDFLSFMDICVMGQTCQRMEKMAGYYVREYFPELCCKLFEGEIQMEYLEDYPLRVDFYQYIRKLYIDAESDWDFVLDEKTFASLKTLTVRYTSFADKQILMAKNVLKNIENIHFDNCILGRDSLEQISQCSPKLKYLHVAGAHTRRSTQQSLFLQHFSALEHLKYGTKSYNFIIHSHELKSFLEKHSKLKHFECDHRFLWANRNSLRETNVQLNVLSIDFSEWTDRTPFDQFIDLVKVLHGHNFYKTLHLTFDQEYELDVEDFTDAISTLPGFQILHTTHDIIFDDLSRLSSLTELHLCNGHESNSNTESMAKNLVNLKRLSFIHVPFEDILKFIRYSKKLESIRIVDLQLSKGFSPNELNVERKKLESACQVTLYLNEGFYLFAKWKTQNDLSHVKIARIAPNFF